MNILDLPENAFRNILYYIENQEVYFTIRSVCRIFKTHSEGYVQLDAKFFLVNLPNDLLLLSQEYENVPAMKNYGRLQQDIPACCILYIFRKYNFARSFYAKNFNPLQLIFYKDSKKFDRIIKILEQYSLLRMVNNSRVLYDIVYVSETEERNTQYYLPSMKGNQIRLRRNTFSWGGRSLRIQQYCHEYNERWMEIGCNEVECSRHNMGRIVARLNFRSLNLIFHEKGMHILKIGKDVTNNVILKHPTWKRTNLGEKTRFADKMFKQYKRDDELYKYQLRQLKYKGIGNEFLWTTCVPMYDPLFSVTAISKEKFIMFAPNPSFIKDGVWCTYCVEHRCVEHLPVEEPSGEEEEYWNVTPKMKLWEGEILKNENVVQWKEITINFWDTDSTKFRFNPICFKLGNYLYIVGGRRLNLHVRTGVDSNSHSTCDRYDFEKKTYCSTKYRLPCDAYMYHCDLQQVVTNQKQTQAIILTENKEIISFTEDEGFEQIFCNCNYQFRNIFPYV
jgi:hypothetical protein